MNGPNPHCPSCGEPYERGQLVCLRCGRRLALGEPTRRSGRAVALVLTVVALGGALLGLAVGVLASGDGEEAAPKVDTGRRLAALQRREAAVERREQRLERRESSAREREQTVAGSWPAGLTAYTVVLVTSGDEASARAVAEEAAAAGLDAGVLRSDDHNLGEGLWIVYAGRFDSQDEAAAEAGRLDDNYSGAYPQLVSAAE